MGLTFAQGFAFHARHDPDVAMVGEVRDLGDGGDRACAAMTGHLVFSTLHQRRRFRATRLQDIGWNLFDRTSVLRHRPAVAGDLRRVPEAVLPPPEMARDLADGPDVRRLFEGAAVLLRQNGLRAGSVTHETMRYDGRPAADDRRPSWRTLSRGGPAGWHAPPAAIRMAGSTERPPPTT
ncbi:MAG: Flp pilus assembly complex ATPase component TadA [Elusimicrobia bacterium]|nr:Flp pilus assembly complex ATPase component TadA [Elusimicrobiota bacterium]